MAGSHPEKQRPRIETSNSRELLRETALTLFTEHGYEGVGTQSIVSSAGVTKPTLYHHFGSKRALLAAVVADLEKALYAELDGVEHYGGDLPLTLESFIARILEFARTRPREARLLPALYYGPRASEARRVVQPVVDRLNGAMRELFRAAAEDHGNMRGRERPYAASLLGLCFTYAQLVVDGEARPSPELAQQVMQQFSHGIYS